MPNYTYHCEECDSYYDISHTMTERVELQCIECSQSLVKILSIPLSLKSKKVDAKTGTMVKSSIEEFKKDLKHQRDEASKKEM